MECLILRSSVSTQCGALMTDVLGILRGTQCRYRIATAPAHGGEAGDTGAEAGKVVRPKQAAGEGIERVQMPVHTDDEAVPIEKEGDVTGARGLPSPHKLARISMNGGDASGEAGKDKAGDLHDGRRLTPALNPTSGRSCGFSIGSQKSGRP